MTSKLIAVDLGAESGRVVVGHLDQDQLRLEEIHRFANGPVRVLESLQWDILRLWSEIKHGLSKTATAYGSSLAGVGLDTWGVDFGLLAADDTLLGNPYHYRDSRTDKMMEAAFDIVPREEIFERTGIQFMQLNSLYQLLAMVKADAPELCAAKTFLNMPDLFHFWLSGRKANEFSIATTSQCYDPRAGDWAREMLDTLDIPSHIFGDIVPPGTILDRMRPAVAEETGCPPIPVIAPGSHDTASAVAAVPTLHEDYVYLSSGTWSLIGVEVSEPVINQQTLEANLTNEGGVNGTFRLLKNIMGLWLVQECRREWSRSGHMFSYDELTEMAATAPPFGPLVNPSDPCFLAPGDMPARIQAYCRDSGQSAPESRGEIVRCALESLALEYRRVTENLSQLVGKPLRTIHIVGGGSKNKLLDQFTANATGRTVVAGPVEATAIGNILSQAVALGQIG
ncbi:MAG: rhamnulokinase family protein, partial [Chloroflexota bacterium]